MNLCQIYLSLGIDKYVKNLDKGIVKFWKIKTSKMLKYAWLEKHNRLPHQALDM